MYLSDIVYYIKQPIKDYVYMKKMMKKINKDISDIEDQRFFIKTKLVRYRVAEFITIDRKTGEEDRFYSTFRAMDSMFGKWLAPSSIYDRINNFIVKQRNFS